MRVYINVTVDLPVAAWVEEKAQDQGIKNNKFVENLIIQSMKEDLKTTGK